MLEAGSEVCEDHSRSDPSVFALVITNAFSTRDVKVNETDAQFTLTARADIDRLYGISLRVRLAVHHLPPTNRFGDPRKPRPAVVAKRASSPSRWDFRRAVIWSDVAMSRSPVALDPDGFERFPIIHHRSRDVHSDSRSQGVRPLCQGRGFQEL